MKRNRLCFLIAIIIVMLHITACGVAAEEQGASDKVVSISLYPADVNMTGGVVGGHKGAFFAENGIELEIWAYSDNKTDAIWASGDLPDIMYVATEDLDAAIESGMLLNLEEYLDDMPHLQAYEPMTQALNYVREYRSAGTGELYCLPLSVGDHSTKVLLSDSTERNAVKLRWDIYEEIGAPPIYDFDELIDVMEQMVEAHPVAEDGTPFYGTVLNSGMDTNYWACMTLWYRWQGYSESQLAYLLEADMVNNTYASILENNSLYYQGLKWYNEVNRRGLMDPDSVNHDRPTQKEKVDNGYAMVPSGSLPGWSAKYYEYYIPNTNIYYSYTSDYGDTNKVIAINANSRHIDTCIKLLDMWCDPDAYFRLINGPEGDFWYVDEKGNAYLTEDNITFIKKNGVGQERTYPSTGEPATLWNTTFCINTGAETSYGDGKGGYRVGRTNSWEEIQEVTVSNSTFSKWQKTTGYDSWKDWLNAEQAYYSDSKLENIDGFCSLPSQEMQVIVDGIRDIVVTASWNMVYAETEQEFQKLWETMVEDCMQIGAEELIQWRLADIENAKAIKESLSQ